MPDWLRRTIRTAVQISLANLLWAVVKLAVFRTITPELDLAVNALCTAIGLVAISATQNAIENTYPNLALLKPEAQVLNANDGKIPGEGAK
jgi:hypothetical protein